MVINYYALLFSPICPYVGCGYFFLCGVLLFIPRGDKLLILLNNAFEFDHLSYALEMKKAG